MLMNRIMGAYMFRKEVYADVEKDVSFTSTAWMLIAVFSFLSQLGSRAGALANRGVVGWILAAIVGTVFAVIGFALSAFVISWVGKTFFQADVNFGEVVRVLGLASVWQVVGFVGILSIISAGLVCILSPLLIVAAILSLAAWLIAVKEALDLDWTKTIITVIIGFIVNWIILAIAGVVLAIFGLGAAAVVGGLQ
jgi:hypothetical protein